MTYRDKVFQAYRDSLISYGVTQQILKAALMAFDTGFSAGTKVDPEEQQKMITGLLNEEHIN